MKTTIAENIVAYGKAHVLAPTNTAVQRLRDKINCGASFATIHKCLFAPTDENGYFTKDKSFEHNKNYVIDECSMIDKYVLDIIVRDAVERNCKIIFLGDSFQLEPIGENPQIFLWEKSYPEVFLPHNRHELTEVKRYDGSLLKIATEMRMTGKPEFVMPENSDLIISPRFSQSLGEDIKGNKSYVILTATNDKRIEYNMMVRAFRYREKKELTTYLEKDERLLAISNSVHHSNGEIFQAKGFRFIGDVTMEIHDQNKKGGGTIDMFQGEKPRVIGEVKFHVYVKQGDDDDDDDSIASIFGSFAEPQVYLVAPRLKDPSMHGPTLAKAYKEGRLKGNKTTINMFIADVQNKMKQRNIYFKKNATIVTFGYAISCHKAQGNEWDNIYIDAPFLMEAWNYARWFYTAITRAKKKVELKPTRFIKILKHG